MKVIEYKLIYAKDFSVFETQIQEAIVQGYQPYGDLLVGNLINFGNLCQVVVKYQQ